MLNPAYGYKKAGSYKVTAKKALWLGSYEILIFTQRGREVERGRRRELTEGPVYS